MTTLRHALRSHPRLAALIFAGALALRVFVPAGFMPGVGAGRFALAICDGYGPVAATPVHAAMPGMHHPPAHSAARDRCAFADLSLPAIGGAAPALLAAALAFALAAALHRRTAVPSLASVRLRPPLRGPPLPV